MYFSMKVIAPFIAILLLVGCSMTQNEAPFFSIESKDTNTLVRKGGDVPPEIEIFYEKFNANDYDGIVDLFDSASLQSNFQSREGLIGYLAFHKEAYGRNVLHTLVSTHKAVNSNSQFIYELDSDYELVDDLSSYDTFVFKKNQESADSKLVNFSFGISESLF